MDRLSTVYLPVPIYAAADPTSYPVRMALLPDGDRPEEADWHPATWTTIAGIPHAQLLIGPDGGAIAPGPGRWKPWIHVDADPERPVIDAPFIEIT